MGCRSSSEWSNTVVSDAVIDNHDLATIGDYDGITHTKTREAYVVWVDHSNFVNAKFDIMGDWSKK